MRVLLVDKDFATPDGTCDPRSFHLARRLVMRGYEVVVLCGSNVHGGVPQVPWHRLVGTFELEGMRLLVCNVPTGQPMGRFRQLWASFRFILLASVAAIAQRVDVIYATSPPGAAAAVAVLAARLRRWPLVFELRDQPLDPRASNRAGRWQLRLERTACRVASRILTDSPAHRTRLLQWGHSNGAIAAFPVGADGTAYAEAEPDVAFLQALGLGDKTVAVCRCTEVDNQELQPLLHAAERLRARTDIALLILGEQTELDVIKSDAAQRGLNNVHVQAVAPDALPGALMACDMALIVGEQSPGWNRLHEYMFAGLPVIADVAGPAADFVEAEEIGQTATPGCAEDLADCIRFYADDPDQRMDDGARACEWAFEKYNRQNVAEFLADTLECAVRERRGATPSHTPAS